MWSEWPTPRKHSHPRQPNVGIGIIWVEGIPHSHPPIIRDHAPIGYEISILPWIMEIQPGIWGGNHLISGWIDNSPLLQSDHGILHEHHWIIRRLGPPEAELCRKTLQHLRRVSFWCHLLEWPRYIHQNETSEPQLCMGWPRWWGAQCDFAIAPMGSRDGYRIQWPQHGHDS